MPSHLSYRKLLFAPSAIKFSKRNKLRLRENRWLSEIGMLTKTAKMASRWTNRSLSSWWFYDYRRFVLVGTTCRSGQCMWISHVCRYCNATLIPWSVWKCEKEINFQVPFVFVEMGTIACHVSQYVLVFSSYRAELYFYWRDGCSVKNRSQFIFAWRLRTTYRHCLILLSVSTNSTDSAAAEYEMVRC